MVTRIPARMIETTGVTAGSYSAADITVNSAGQITSASTSSVASSGGGPKITSIVVTDSSYTNTDDTAVGLSGGYIKVTGTGFSTGCSVIIGTVVATSVSFISSTEVRAQVPAQSAGTYTVYLVNSDGGVGIRVNGLNYSSTPTWTTTSPLGDGAIDTAVSIQLVATSNSVVTFTLEGGSTLPAGLTLSSSGLITGTVTGITVDTTYNFTVVATDTENQDTPQAFSITITVNDPYFKNTVLLLQADTAPTVITDSSTNNFDLTVVGDTRASNFTPYGTGWSTYFSSTSGLTISGLTPLGSGDFTIETFVYMTTLSGEQHFIQQGTSTTNLLLAYDGVAQKLRFFLRNDSGSSNFDINSPAAPVINQWFHLAGTVEGTTCRMWINGNVVTTGTVSGTRSGSQTFVYMGDNATGGGRPFTGYLSNTRIVVGTAVYTANFVPTTTNLSSVAGTSLLTNQSNRFINLVGNVAATISQGSPRVTSFNPFNLTNTGVNGSAYFDGTGDYISLANNAAFTPGTGSVTIEAWIYCTSLSNTYQGIISGRTEDAGSSYPGLGLVIDNSKLYFTIGANTSALADPDNVSLNQWIHVVGVRSGTNAALFVNGVRKASTVNSTVNGTTSAMSIGRYYPLSNNYHFNGYIADARIIKGSAAYDPTQSTITIPTISLTTVTNTQLLTLQYRQPHNNHGFQDSSTNNFLITRNGNASQGSFSPFSLNGWSNYLNGSSSLLVTTSAAFAAAGEDFTVEFWINRSSISNQMICGYFNVVSDYLFLTPNAISINANNTYTIDSGALSWQIGTWYHVAISRTSGVVKIFRDGNQVGSNISNSSSFGVAGNICIGDWTANSPRYYFTGYISDFRFVKGIGVYTGNFQVPTTLLGITQSADTNILAISGTQTKLLMCQGNRFLDISGNATSITTQAGTPLVQPLSPLPITTSYTPALHGGSAYFDGSGDYLLAPYNDAFDYRTSDFTIELWLYPLSHPAQAGIWIQSPNASAFGPIWLWLASGVITLAATTADGTFNIVNSVSVSGTIPLNSWTHFALTRTSGVWRSFVNGAQFWTITNSGSLFVLNTSIGIGGWVDNTRHFNGYFSGYRALKGVSAYTSNFTPPTAPASPTAATSLLLNFTDAAIRDGRGISVLETLGDTKTSTVQVKYGTGSMRFDGTGDYLVPYNVNTNTYAFGSGDFTIEFWVRFGALAGNQMIYDSRPSATDGLYPMIYASGTSLRYYVNAADRITSGTISTNTWYHVAVARSATSTKMFIDGTQAGSTYTDSTVYINAANRPLIAQNGTNLGAALNGYIDELRVTQGVARYTANFTPPASKFLSR